MKQNLFLPSGYRLEFWAAGNGFFRINIDGKTVWQVPSFAIHPEFFKYHHREACEVTIVTNAPGAVLWAYGYQPQTVNETGITVFEFSEKGILQRTGAEIEDWLRSDPDRPALHFSPIRHWMNDPVGLCKIGELWHLFYQFHPRGSDWGPMHWGHATSRDLVNWLHMPVFLHPEQNLWRLGATGGAFSGNAFRDRDGSLMFFYTERLPAYDLFKGYREIQKIARPDRRMIKAEGIVTVLEQRPDGVEHDFRDPKVWWDDAANAYRMVLGASIHGDPAVLLYGSDDLFDWTYLGPLYRAPGHFRDQGARAVECPDFFPIDGKWVLIMGFVGHLDPESGRHNLLYGLVGDFVDDRFIPDSDALQLLDFGTDFYAMQSLSTAGRQIAFAWLFNWEFRKPVASPYSGELSLPRELFLDDRKRICMKPVKEAEAAFHDVVIDARQAGNYALPASPVDIRVSGNLTDIKIVATQSGELSFAVFIADKQISVHLPQDDGSIRYGVATTDLIDLRIIHDRGVVEIFANGGTVAGTRRSYMNITPDAISVEMAAAAHILVLAAALN
ncbi:GH32 C-terminal domain-containing protein [Rhizobium mongolense]|uniref:glycoside hydrolase family 32 protein n=1 Tax=Rhizobium TaxID=379 RepID=UPI0024B24D88|nr:glycoside hydrolase family 32 protein [Rhizobium sp. CC1099]WFU91827.1 glycoside hydrolase family 32 protein [Rhizobium sp. CC1099]